MTGAASGKAPNFTGLDIINNRGNASYSRDAASAIVYAVMNPNGSSPSDTQAYKTPGQTTNFNPGQGNEALPYTAVGNSKANYVNEAAFKSLPVADIMGRMIFHESATSKMGMDPVAWSMYYNIMTRGYSEATMKNKLWEIYGRYITSQFDAYYDPDAWINDNMGANFHPADHFNYAMGAGSALFNGTIGDYYNPFTDSTKIKEGFNPMKPGYTYTVEFRPADYTDPAPMLVYDNHGFRWYNETLIQ